MTMALFFVYNHSRDVVGYIYITNLPGDAIPQQLEDPNSKFSGIVHLLYEGDIAFYRFTRLVDAEAWGDETCKIPWSKCV